MQAESTMDAIVLDWLREGLDESIQRLLQALESLSSGELASPENALEAIEILDQLDRVLSMADQHAVRVLITEMSLACRELAEREEYSSDFLAPLAQGAWLLTPVIDQIQSARHVTAVALLDTVNAIRSARGVSLLTARDIQIQQLLLTIAAEEPAWLMSSDTDSSSASLRFTTIRTQYEQSLLGWLRGDQAQLGEIDKLLSSLKVVAEAPREALAWGLMSELTHQLQAGAIEPSVQRKMLFGRVSRILRSKISESSIRYETELDDLARAVFSDLIDVLPNSESLIGMDVGAVKAIIADAEVQPNFVGLDHEALLQVSQVIKEELEAIQDVLDMFVRGKRTDLEPIGRILPRLHQIASSMEVIEVQAMGESLSAVGAELEEVLQGAAPLTDDLLMRLACAVMATEIAVDLYATGSFLSDQSPSQLNIADLSIFGALDAVAATGLEDLLSAKNAIHIALNDREQSERLKDAQLQLTRIHSVLHVVGLHAALPLLQGLKNWVAAEISNPGGQREESVLMALAGVFAAVEYYFENLKRYRRELRQFLAVGLDDLARLEDALNVPAEKTISASVQGDDQTSLIPDVLESNLEVAVLAADGEGGESIDEIDKEVSAPVAASSSGFDPRFEVVVEEVDAGSMEVRQVFAEEVGELIDELESAAAQWQSRIRDMDLIGQIRRGFHTIKGSSRIVGLTAIGDWAWAHEEMLNRVLEGGIAPTAKLAAHAASSIALLKEALPVLQAGYEPGAGYWQVSRVTAESLSRSSAEAPETLPAEPAPSVDHDLIEESVEAALEPDLAAEAEQSSVIEVEPDSSDATEHEPAAEVSKETDESMTWSLDDLSLVEKIDEAPETTASDFISPVDESLEPLSLDSWEESVEKSDAEDVVSEDSRAEAPAMGTELVWEHETDAAQQDAPSETFEAVSEPPPVTSQEPESIIKDPVLRDIFDAEVSGYIQDLQNIVSHALRAHISLAPDQTLIRLTHTLLGAARTAGVKPMARLADAMESLVRVAEDRQHRLHYNELELLAEAVDMSDTLRRWAIAPSSDEPAIDDLVSRIEAAIATIESGEEARSAQVLAERLEQGDVSGFTDSMRLREVVAEQPVPVKQALSSGAGDGDLSVRADDLPKEQDPDVLEIFLEEAEELIEAADGYLAQWRASPSSKEPIHQLRRNLHTLKGGARMAGLLNIADVTHALEDRLDAVRDQGVEDVTALINVVQQTYDVLSSLLDKVRKLEPIPAQTQLLALLRGEAIDAVATASESLDRPEAPAPLEEPVDEPMPEAKPESVSRSEVVAEEAPVVEQVSTSAYIEPKARVAEESSEQQVHEESFEPEVAPKPVEPQQSNTLVEPTVVAKSPSFEWPEVEEKPVTTASRPNQADDSSSLRQPAKSVVASRDQLRVDAGKVDELVNFAGESMIMQARIERQISGFERQLEELQHTVIRLRNQLRRLEIETEAQMIAKLKEETGLADEDFDPLEFDRFTQLQELSRGIMETLGDISNIQEALVDIAEDSQLLLVQQARLGRNIQEELLALRLVRFNDISTRLRRIVRQTAEELGKQAELVIIGGDTELDRVTLLTMLPALEHMIRNALAHGIESADERVAQGKPAVGKLEIRLESQGGNILMTISDDGRGLDLEAIRRKAFQLGLVEDGSQLSDEDARMMIFASGLSTATSVSQVAGRGVGMDVVASAVRQMGGFIDIDSERNKGTKIKINLPLTQALTRGVLVAVADERFAIPYKGIVSVIRVPGDVLADQYASEHPTLQFEGQDYPLVYLGDLLWGTQVDRSLNKSEIRPVILLKLGERRFAVQVDHQLGVIQLFVKSLGRQLSRVPGLAGATIADDGEVTLVLEMAELLRRHRQSSKAKVRSTRSESSRPVVLVVDDSITIRKVTARTLERNNIEVILARDGVEALGVLHDMKPDLVLSDIEMPRMDGFELLGAIRNDPRTRDLPVVMITSRTGEKHRTRASGLGVNAYLGKPYTEAELLAEIERWVPKAALTQEHQAEAKRSVSKPTDRQVN